MNRLDGADREVPGDRLVIEVDVGSLEAFAGTVESEVDTAMRVRVSELLARYGDGVSFGTGGVSGTVSQARQRCRDCTTAVVRQLLGLVDGAVVLARSARAVAASYTEADALAVASSRVVTESLATLSALDAEAGADVVHPPATVARNRPVAR